jgi:hypothetical protein
VCDAIRGGINCLIEFMPIRKKENSADGRAPWVHPDGWACENAQVGKMRTAARAA